MTLWLALSSFVMVVLVGLAVDLTGQVHAQQRARDVAAQAARVGGQQLNASQAVRGLGAQASPTQAVRAAQLYLNASDVSGTVGVVNGTTLVVSTTDIYQPKFLSIVGLGNMRVSGKAEARLVRAVGGVER
ncbi:pilus assembly protein TadG-related protein [Actinopolymorpha pittospori]|uniref:Flp pilus assembly protein TadG n=1 Tax=Actinopolymorpha pittospori TaxID=648752 RepID=A0A927N121_9ACTN|nr:Flp pilus assembly protein TadG [Actinopolymorpha pittospori]